MAQELQRSGLHIFVSLKQLSSTCHVSFLAALDTDHQHMFSLTHFLHFSLSNSFTDTHQIFLWFSTHEYPAMFHGTVADQHKSHLSHLTCSEQCRFRPARLTCSSQCRFRPNCLTGQTCLGQTCLGQICSGQTCSFQCRVGPDQGGSKWGTRVARRVGGLEPRKVGARRVGGPKPRKWRPKGWEPKGGGAKFRVFFTSPAPFSLFFSSLWGSLRGILTAVQSRSPAKERVWASLGSFCKSPGCLQAAPTVPGEDPQEREDRLKIVAGQGKKVRHFGRSGDSGVRGSGGRVRGSDLNRSGPKRSGPSGVGLKWSGLKRSRPSNVPGFFDATGFCTVEELVETGETRFIVGFDFATILFSPSFPCILFAIVSVQLVKLKF